MTKFQKWLIVINISILVLVLVKLIFFRGKEEWTPPPLVDNTELIEDEKMGIDSLQTVLDSLEMEISDRDLEIISKNYSLIQMKNNHEKQKRSINLLPADESISFFADFINEE